MAAPAGWYAARMTKWLVMLVLLAYAPALTLMGGCAARPGKEVRRHGDEIVIAGRMFRTGAPVVLWTDPGGYDAYRVERRFVPWEDAGWEKTHAAGVNEPSRYGVRFHRERAQRYTPEQFEAIRGGGWSLDLLREHVDQFVIHYDVCGTSRACFRVLHDMRGLSVHFMLDIDGTIYQTLDVKERAWHAGPANDRSVGIEIANIGAYPPGNPTLPRWYATDEQGVRIRLPASAGDGGVRTRGFVGRPVRQQPVRGVLHGQELEMYDLTPEQYDSLIRLTATLCTVLPKIRPEAPRDEAGNVLTREMTEEEQAAYAGLIGHLHLTKGKIDPGPAFDWDKVTNGAKRLMRR